eukprot:2666108-Amphidinium_carterae.1
MDVTSEIFCDTGLAKIWNILDEEYVLPDYRRSDEAQAQYDKCHRAFQQPVSDYLQQLRVCKRRLETEDEGTALSDVSYARHILRKAGLTREEQRQVRAACGAVWSSRAIADAMRLMYSELHLEDRNRMARMNNCRGTTPYRGRGGGKGDKKGKGHGPFVTEPTTWEEEGVAEHDVDEEDVMEEHSDAEIEESSEEDPDEVLETYFTAKQKLEKYKDKGRFGGRKNSDKDKKSVEEKKKTSKCADCGRVGHWRGDPACPKVRSGATPAYQKKTTATSSGTLWVDSHPCLVVASSAARPSAAPSPKRLPTAIPQRPAVASTDPMEDDDPAELADVVLSPYGVLSRHASTQTDPDPHYRQIKHWLRSRGLSLKGNKGELISRMLTSTEPDLVACPHAMSGTEQMQLIVGRGAKTVGRSCTGCARPLVLRNISSVMTLCLSSRVMTLLVLCKTAVAQRKSVAGEEWHSQMHVSLEEKGLKAVIWRYPLKMCGCVVPVVIAEVACPCPPLLSHEVMKELGMVLHLGKQCVDIESLGVHGHDLLHSARGHPMLRVSDFQMDDVVPEEFQSTGASQDHGTMVVSHKRMPKEKCEKVKLILRNTIVPMTFSRTNREQDEAPRSVLLGAYTRGGVGIARKTLKRASLVSAIHELALHRPCLTEYVAIMVNEHTSLAVHKDLNLGTSWICALGEFTGGRLWQPDERNGVYSPPGLVPADYPMGLKGHCIDIRHHWHELSGSQWHAVEQVHSGRTFQPLLLGEIVRARLEDVEVLVLPMLRDRSAATVARTLTSWKHGCQLEVIGLEGSWQAGLIERHGAVLGEIMRAAIELASIDGPAEIKMAYSYAARCKNRRIDSSGHSARTRVFGVQERWPHSVVDSLQEGENLADLSQLEGGQVQRTFEIRTAAQQALLELDASARWHRALTGMPAPEVREWPVGTTVYFWRKARGARLLERWHGPAIVIGQDRRHVQTARNYWLVFGTHLLLVPAEHLRSATSEEIVACDIMRERIQNIQQTPGEDGNQVTYWDLSQPEQTQDTIDVAEFRADGRDSRLTPATRPREISEPDLEPAAREPIESSMTSTCAYVEWTEFLKADYDQWMAHVKTNAVKIIPPAVAVKIDPRLVLRLPARFVRTDKGTKLGKQELVAKSRLGIPGHVADRNGVRVDCP